MPRTIKELYGDIRDDFLDAKPVNDIKQRAYESFKNLYGEEHAKANARVFVSIALSNATWEGFVREMNEHMNNKVRLLIDRLEEVSKKYESSFKVENENARQNPIE